MEHDEAGNAVQLVSNSYRGYTTLGIQVCKEYLLWGPTVCKQCLLWVIWIPRVRTVSGNWGGHFCGCLEHQGPTIWGLYIYIFFFVPPILGNSHIEVPIKSYRSRYAPGQPGYRASVAAGEQRDW